MAQSGYTPILIYGSGTTGNTPSAGNLTSSAAGAELALNYFDGRLFYKDNAGVVQILAVKMPSGVLPVANGGTGASTFTANGVIYGNTTGALQVTAAGTTGQVLVGNTGSAPSWSAATGVAVTSLSFGTTGLTPAVATQGAITVAGTLVVANGGTGLTSLTANRIPYGAGTSAFANSASLTFDGSTLTVNSVNVGRGGGAVSTNTAVGATALNANTTGFRNTALGTEALFTNTASGDSTALGYRALYVGTGAFNTAVGSNALLANTTGTQNTVVGSSSGLSTTTGRDNTVVGYAAIAPNTTGSFLTAVGSFALGLNTTASNNVAVGYTTAYSNTTGTRNTAVGTEALYTNTTSNDSTALGYRALFVSTGASNTAVGSSALVANTTGSFNIAMGQEALNSNTTSPGNIAIGYRALFSNTTAAGQSSAGSVAIGHTALFSNTTGNTNVAIGGASFQISNLGALYSNTTGNWNVAVGPSALASNSTGVSNVAVGSGALVSNTTAARNTAVGHVALQSNTTGTNNVAVGGPGDAISNEGALGKNTTGNFNVAVGNAAALSNTTGGNNVAVGWGSLFSNSTASNNTAVGYQAAYGNTTASNNVAVGYQAGYSVTGSNSVAVGAFANANATSSGNGNIAIGAYSLFSNTTGQHNIAIGSVLSSIDSTMNANTTGSYNVAIGHLALDANTTSSNNVAVGYAALNLSTGSVNTAIGNGAGSAITTGSKNTIIGSYSGNQGSLDIRTSSNNIVLSDGDGNPRLYINSSGNTFLNTVSGTGWAAGSAFITRINSTSFAGAAIGDPSGVTASNAQFSLTAWLGSGNNYFSSRFTTLSNGDLTFSTQAAASVDASGTSTERFRITSGGQVAMSSDGTAAAPVITRSTDLNTGIFFPAADTIAFAEGGVEQARFPSTGGLQVVNCVSVGNVAPSTSGAGITFPATQSASSDANTLDDYEEGTWTPGISFGGASTGVTYNSGFNGGTYTKIGNSVTVRGTLVLSSNGSSTGDARLTGLPFTSPNSSGVNGSVTICPSSVTFTGQVWMSIELNATTCLLRQTTEAGVRSNLTNANFVSNSDFSFVYEYRV